MPSSPTISVMQTSFTSGVWAPSLRGRIDLDKSPAAMRTLKNCLVHPHGGVSNRGGTYYVDEVYDSDKETRVIDFTFSITQGYELEFGDQYMRVIKDGSIVGYGTGNGHDIGGADGVADGNKVYKWTRPGGAGTPYYCEREDSPEFGADALTQPTAIYEDYLDVNKLLSTAALGSLTAGTWNWGDNDGLGYDTVYVRLTADKDPSDYYTGFLRTDTRINLIDPDKYKWTVSPADAQEYYLSRIDNPNISEPMEVYENGVTLTKRTTFAGIIDEGEWWYGDNDSLGYNTIYLRATGDVDPDTYTEGYLEMGGLVTPWLEADMFRLYYTQSADVLYVTHPSYQTRKISRLAHDKWTIEATDFEPQITAPETLTTNTAASSSYFGATAVNANGSESRVKLSDSTPKGTDNGATITLDLVPGARHYNLYGNLNNETGLKGWVGRVLQSNNGAGKVVFAATQITNNIANPDFDQNPPSGEDPFVGTDNYPGVCTFFEQRLHLARTNKKPQTIFGSVVGDFENFMTSDTSDSGSYEFEIASQQINDIRWMIPMDALIIGTGRGEWRMEAGNNSDSVTPTSVDLKPMSNWGSTYLRPVVIGNQILFVTSSGNKIRDLGYSLEADSYVGNDLTIMANHLFEGKTIVDWCYQQNPDSVLWVVFSDGIMAGLTYHREHQVFAWYEWETNGKVESICCRSNDTNFDTVTMIVRRYINGSYVRYIEQMKPRMENDDLQNSFFVDCGLSLDSPFDIIAATSANPVAITTSTNHGFSNDDYVDIVDLSGGKGSVVTDSDGNTIGMTELNGNRYIVANQDGTTGFTLKDLDGNAVDGSAFSTYVEGGEVRKCVTSVSGAGHLEGEEVSVLANGSVVDGLSVSSGAITLPSMASRVHLGLGYTSEIETNEINYQTREGVMQHKKRRITSVTLRLNNSRSVEVGPNSAARLYPLALRKEERYTTATDLFSGDIQSSIDPGMFREGRIYIKNDNPTPFTILALIAEMQHGDR